MRVRKIHSLPNQIEQIPSRKIFFADLYPFDAGGQITGNVGDQRRASRQIAAVGDVAVEHALSV